MVTWSPSRRCSESTRSPLTKVPLVEPRSDQGDEVWPVDADPDLAVPTADAGVVEDDVGVVVAGPGRRWRP